MNVNTYSKLDYCQVAVYEECNKQNKTLVSTFRNVSLSIGSETVAGMTTVTDLSLSTGKIYTAKIRCFNRAGLYTDVISDGVLVDAFPPVTTKIHDTRFEDVLQVDTVDRDYQANLTGIRTKWKLFTAASELEACFWSLKNQSKVVVSEQEISSSVFRTRIRFCFFAIQRTTLVCDALVTLDCLPKQRLTELLQTIPTLSLE